MFDNFIKTLRDKTNWGEPKINEENHSYFVLLGKNDEELELEFFTPDDVSLIMQTKIRTLPSNDNEKTTLLRDFAKRQVAACKSRPSILTIDNDTVILYRKDKMTNNNRLVENVGEFLKDIDWWRQDTSRSASPFSFSMSWGK